jgi:hypothetical protein
MADSSSEPLNGAPEASSRREKKSRATTRSMECVDGANMQQLSESTTVGGKVTDGVDCSSSSMRGSDVITSLATAPLTSADGTLGPADDMLGQASSGDGAAEAPTASMLLQVAISMFPNGSGPPLAAGGVQLAACSSNELILNAMEARDALFDHFKVARGESLTGPVDREEALGYLLGAALQPGVLAPADARTVGARARKHGSRLPQELAARAKAAAKAAKRAGSTPEQAAAAAAAARTALLTATFDLKLPPSLVPKRERRLPVRAGDEALEAWCTRCGWSVDEIKHTVGE